MSESDLWQEVLLRVMTDARLVPSAWPVLASACDETTEARAYLTTTSDDLAQVCSFAGAVLQALLLRMQGRVAKAPPVKATGKSKRNTIRQNNPPMITYAGETRTIGQWVKRTGINQATIRDRLKKGWPMEQVMHLRRPGAGAELEQSAIAVQALP